MNLRITHARTGLFSPVGLLIVAALLHIAATVTIFTLSRNEFLPGAFDTNGTAVSFAHDGVGYREDAVTLAESLRSGELREWSTSVYPFHVKLYSTCFAIFGSFLGFNILGAEPFNLICYLAILILTYKLGAESFGKREGLIAAAVVALWPSFLVHTTQLLKDPIFILGMLAIILFMTRLLTRTYSWRHSMLNGLFAASISAVLWKTRSDLGPVLIATAVLGAAALTLRQLQAKRVIGPNLASMALLLIMTGATILWLSTYRDSDSLRHQDNEVAKARMNDAEIHMSLGWWQVGARVGVIRQRFVTMYPESSSNIDADVKLTNTSDLIRYLPRAAAIGLFAPFPNMWFEPGSSVGSRGRILSGLETVLMYAVEALALIGLWRWRRQLSVWLLFSIATMGTIALGLVVVNVGTLYRLRYLFLILLIILATSGTAQFLEWRRKDWSLTKKVVA